METVADHPANAPGSIKPLLTPEEAAGALSTGRAVMYRLLRTNQILSVKVGGSRRVPLRAFGIYVEWLCEQEERR
jgi:excisionase family DNA binding protein